MKDFEYYTYIFVRTDLPTKEQMLVQASHATLVLGHELSKNGIIDDSDHLNFVVCGAKSELDLDLIQDYINEQGYKTVSFWEDTEKTAIASYPILATKRDFMANYKLLKFE